MRLLISGRIYPDSFARNIAVAAEGMGHTVETVDPALIYFRSTPRFETAAPEYRWLMQSLFICSGARFPDRVELRF